MMLDRGAVAHEEPADVRGGVKVASLRDPRDNVLRIIYESQSGDGSADGETGVTALGGIFRRPGPGSLIRSPVPGSLKRWYEEHLGIPNGKYGTNFRWKKAMHRHGYTVWSPFDKKTDYFGSYDQSFMINYRVKNLNSLIENLKNKGITIPKEPESYGYGKFAWI